MTQVLQHFCSTWAACLGVVHPELLSLQKTLNRYCVCLLYFQEKEVHSAASFEVVVYIHFNRLARLSLAREWRS